MSTDKVKVAIRIRPLNNREVYSNATTILKVDQNQVSFVSNGCKNNNIHIRKSFVFDYCFGAIERCELSNQDEIFKCLGVDVLNNAFFGYNTCIFAYGQTGSGKSYTMMGSQTAPGLIPRLSEALFSRIEQFSNESLSFKVEVSYLEIYNERVRDLLNVCDKRQVLKVREHSILGPYVGGLSVLAVSSFMEIEQLICEGNRARTVAATNMNEESSRSHAVFTVILTQTITESGVVGEKVSRIALVDLAGSERVARTGAMSQRLREGGSINRSLSTLGLVISKLAENSGKKLLSQELSKSSDSFVPYRDSVLTWLLKDNLGGNSRTVMLATVSPASDNYEETLSTLRFADRAKRIVNHAIINEDPNARIIRELKAEVSMLRQQLSQLKYNECDSAALTAGESAAPCVQGESVGICDQLDESERLVRQMSETWEEKLLKSDRLQRERQLVTARMGLDVIERGADCGDGCVLTSSSSTIAERAADCFHLTSLSADPSLCGALVYYIKARTVVGLAGSHTADIQLAGVGIRPEHCVLCVESTTFSSPPSDSARLYMWLSPGALCRVNGRRVTAERSHQLAHGDTVLWGHAHLFRVNYPRRLIGDYVSSPRHLDDPTCLPAVSLSEYEGDYRDSGYQDYRFLSQSDLYLDLTSDVLLTNINSEEREKQFQISFKRLKRSIVQANVLIREANMIASELDVSVLYSLSLQIPLRNLVFNSQTGLFICEPVIKVEDLAAVSAPYDRLRCARRQMWTMAQFEEHLFDMRDHYSDVQTGLTDLQKNVFFERDHGGRLLGVANIFMEVIFCDNPLSHAVPIINQQGEVIGRLQIQIQRLMGNFHEQFDQSTNYSYDSAEDIIANTITCRLSVVKAFGLAYNTTETVYCQYHFWGCSQTQICHPIDVMHANGSEFIFKHERDFVIPVCDEFLEYCHDGALSIEIYSENTCGSPLFHTPSTLSVLASHWSNVTRKLRLSVYIYELDPRGDYRSVTVEQDDRVTCGGLYQLCQGKQRRVGVRVQSVPHSGHLSLQFHSIQSLSIGPADVRCLDDPPLDSYTDFGLETLRGRWTEVLERRRAHLAAQLQPLLNMADKSAAYLERECLLMQQWLHSSEEQNCLLLPPAGSGIPGAPVDTTPSSQHALGCELHTPVLFIDTKQDEVPTVGYAADIDGGECRDQLVACRLLPVQQEEEECTETGCSALAHWHSACDTATYQLTPNDRCVYLWVTCVLRLAQPHAVDLTLRKRICVTVQRPPGLGATLVRGLRCLASGHVRTCGTSVIYQLVSGIPEPMNELESRESLAQLAVQSHDVTDSREDNDNNKDNVKFPHIDKYLHCVTCVERILHADRMRQRLLVSSPPQYDQRHSMSRVSQTIQRTFSVPNFGSSYSYLSNFMGPIVEHEIYQNGHGNNKTHRLPASHTMITLCEEDVGSRETPVHLANVSHHTETRSPPFSHSKGRTGSGLRPSKSFHLSTNQLANGCYRNPVIRELQHQTVRTNPSADASKYENSDEILISVGSDTTQSPDNRDTVDDAYILLDVGEISADSQLTMVDDTNTTVVDKNTAVVDKNTAAMVDKNTAVVDKNTAVVDKNTALVDKNTAVVDKNTALVDKNTAVVDKNTALVDKNTALVDKNTALVDKNTAVVDKNTAAMVDKNTALVDKNTAVVDKNTALVDKNTAAMVGAVSGTLLTTDLQTSQFNKSNSIVSASSKMASNYADVKKWMKVGEHVLVKPHSHAGIIRYVGEVSFSHNYWVGVQLDLPHGKNNGVVQGVRYFCCTDRHGLFVRPDRLVRNTSSRHRG